MDIEPNCLNDAKHPLFVIENCKNLYTELLLHLENFESIQNFGKVMYTISGAARFLKSPCRHGALGLKINRVGTDFKFFLPARRGVYQFFVSTNQFFCLMILPITNLKYLTNQKDM